MKDGAGACLDGGGACKDGAALQGIAAPLRSIVSIYGTADAGVIGNEVRMRRGCKSRTAVAPGTVAPRAVARGGRAEAI